MRRRVAVSVPGKLILMGEHSAVYGRPALVAALGLRARIEIAAGASGVRIDLPDIGCRASMQWSEVLQVVDSARQAWQEYAENPTPEGFEALKAGDATRLTVLALGEAAKALDLKDPPPIELSIRSQIPVGSGFGSSAALSVGVVAALSLWHTGQIDYRSVDATAFEVERRQHGLPSGVDQKTVLHGGVLLVERNAQGGLEVEPIDGRNPLLDQLGIYHTGPPNETTGVVVAAVARRRQQDPDAFERILDRMGSDVLALRLELARGSGSPGVVNDLIQDFEGYLEEIGVVPKAVADVIRRIERSGGSAKISGAGALTGDSAGCLLAFRPDADEVKARDGLGAYRHFPVPLGAEGLRIEVSE